MAGGGIEVLETDVERTVIFENGLLDPHGDLRSGDERSALALDHRATEESHQAERSDTLPVPRDEKRFPDGAAGAPSDEADALGTDPVEADPPKADPSKADSPPAAAPQAEKRRDTQPWSAKLTMVGVALVALVGLVVLAVAIAREVTAGNSSEDAADIGFSYLCDKISGSDPGVYGVGHCHASEGLQASGTIPVGQSYVLTPRTANALGYTQSYACSGGRVISPGMVVPKRCAAIGNPVLASR